MESLLANGTNSGAGGVIKLNDTSSITWTCNCGPGTNTRAEFLGVWETLLLASRLHIYNLQVLGDSRIVIDWCNNRGKLQVIALNCWKVRFRELFQYFNKLSFNHIYRELNMEADKQ
jgi:ribonuclease HI